MHKWYDKGLWNLCYDGVVCIDWTMMLLALDVYRWLSYKFSFIINFWPLFKVFSKYIIFSSLPFFFKLEFIYLYTCSFILVSLPLCVEHVVVSVWRKHEIEVSFFLSFPGLVLFNRDGKLMVVFWYIKVLCN